MKHLPDTWRGTRGRNSIRDAHRFTFRYAPSPRLREKARETETKDPLEVPYSPYWVIANHENGRLHVLTVARTGGRLLPVFSSGEEAGRFLEHTMLSSGWQVRETSSGELVSILLGPCLAIERVALDPPAETDDVIALDLVSMDRRDFMERFCFPATR